MSSLPSKYIRNLNFFHFLCDYPSQVSLRNKVLSLIRKKYCLSFFKCCSDEVWNLQQLSFPLVSWFMPMTLRPWTCPSALDSKLSSISFFYKCLFSTEGQGQISRYDLRTLVLLFNLINFCSSKPPFRVK